MSNKVIFLDYDGVVNTPMWRDDGGACCYNYPSDGKVNNFQAVQWISCFCKNYHYDIVVSSTWRKKRNYKECLINAGLWNGVKVIGKTLDSHGYQCRGSEIQSYLDLHQEIEHYIIIDDEDDILPDQRMNFVQTDGERGFGIPDYRKCVEIVTRDSEQEHNV